MGCDPAGAVRCPRCAPFQSTHPVWGATNSVVASPVYTDISIHAPRVGCDEVCQLQRCRSLVISIHAPRVGCDERYHPTHGAILHISIHAPRVGCDACPGLASRWAEDFNPRTPCGVRQKAHQLVEELTKFQSTHPVWGATLWAVSCSGAAGISIHAPRVGCDRSLRSSGGIQPRFQSTHPVWGATREYGVDLTTEGISIHAPRVGCDSASTGSTWPAM